MVTVNGEGNYIYNQEGLIDYPNLKITVAGNHNVIKVKHEALRGGGVICISIEGNNNEVIIDDITVAERLAVCVVDDEHLVKIDAGSSFIDTTISLADKGNRILIGSNCMFSRGITLLTSDFHSVIDMNSNNRINWGKDIVIEDSVWVGMDAVILKGAVVGRGAVVGARSVVTLPVSSYSLAVGMPAKSIRSGITWERERRETCIYKPAASLQQQHVRGRIQYNLERFDTCLEDRLLEGWAFINGIDNTKKEGWIEIVFQDISEMKRMSVGLYFFDRIDVAQYFQNNHYVFSGFKGYVPVNIQKIKQLILYLKIESGSYTEVIYNDIQQ